MKLIKKVLLGLACISAFGLSETASATAFTVTGGSFDVGSGYGTGAGQLDVSFIDQVATQSFTLNPGDSTSFRFGKVKLGEQCINSGAPLIDVFACGFRGLDGDETNNLGVTANLTFSDPIAATVQSIAVTGAFIGPVNGVLLENYIPDYFIDFSPVTIDFGAGGSFVVELSDLWFFHTGGLNTDAMITLTAAPTAVPEPATLAMLAIGLLGFGMVRRRKQ